MPKNWIFTRLGGVYLSFWLAVAAVYEALFLLSPDVDYSVAVYTGLTIIGVPALLGLIVITVALRLPVRFENTSLLVGFHLLGALAYALLWVAVVMAIRNLELLLTVDDYVARVPPAFVVRWHIIAGAALYAAMVTGVYAVRAIAAAHVEREQAEMKALRAQLNPHFMFNTLHTISMLFRRDSNKAEEAMEVFSGLVRYALEPPKPVGLPGGLNPKQTRLVRLAEEWRAAEQYLHLEQLRLGPRLRVTQNIDQAAMSGAVPPMIMQPLLENAVVHGAAVSEKGAEISISVKKNDEKVEIEIENDLARPFSEDALQNGIGMASVRARLKDVFFGKEQFNFHNLDTGGFRVLMKFPYWKSDQ